MMRPLSLNSSTAEQSHHLRCFSIRQELLLLRGSPSTFLKALLPLQVFAQNVSYLEAVERNDIVMKRQFMMSNKDLMQALSYSVVQRHVYYPATTSDPLMMLGIPDRLCAELDL